MAYPDGFHLKGFIINGIIFFIPRLCGPAQFHAKLGTRQYEVSFFFFFNSLALLKVERQKGRLTLGSAGPGGPDRSPSVSAEAWQS